MAKQVQDKKLIGSVEPGSHFMITATVTLQFMIVILSGSDPNMA